MDEFEATEGTVWRDVILLVLLGMVAVVILLISWINPESREEAKSPGLMVITMTWPDELDVDVDLWVQAPGDQPVGYSAKNGTVFDLLRDDLGHSNDPSGINAEMVASRGLPDGEYIVNVHLYSNRAEVYPVRVYVDVRIKGKASMRSIIGKAVFLRHKAQEITVARWNMADKALVNSSVHDIPIPLRAQK